MTSADVISELRAARPVAGEALRERVRELAVREPEPRRARFGSYSWRRVSTVALPVTAAVALATAGAIGLSRSGTDELGARADQTTSREAAAPASTTPGAATDSSRGKLSPGTPAIGPVAGRPQRFSAQLTIEVSDSDALSAATQRALQITRSLGGYAVSVSFGSAEESGTSSLVVRVPTAKVQDAITRLSSLGTIVAEQVQIDDLGDQAQSLEQQERSLREQIARLTARLQSEELTDEQRAVLEARRATARRQLADVRQQRAALQREASLATIALSLRTEDNAGVPAPQSRLDRTLDEALNVLAWEAIVLLYGVIVVAPIALVAALAYFGARVRRRRENDRLLAAS